MLEVFTWPIAVTTIAGVVTIVLGIIKIVSMRRKPLVEEKEIERLCEDLKYIKKELDKMEDDISDIKESVSVQEAITEENKEDLKHLHEHFDKLNETFIKLLTEE